MASRYQKKGECRVLLLSGEGWLCEQSLELGAVSDSLKPPFLSCPASCVGAESRGHRSVFRDRQGIAGVFLTRADLPPMFCSALCVRVCLKLFKSVSQGDKISVARSQQQQPLNPARHRSEGCAVRRSSGRAAGCAPEWAIPAGRQLTASRGNGTSGLSLNHQIEGKQLLFLLATFRGCGVSTSKSDFMGYLGQRQW